MSLKNDGKRDNLAACVIWKTRHRIDENAGKIVFSVEAPIKRVPPHNELDYFTIFDPQKSIIFSRVDISPSRVIVSKPRYAVPYIFLSLSLAVSRTYARA